jgi:hypothetical protein
MEKMADTAASGIAPHALRRGKIVPCAIFCAAGGRMINETTARDSAATAKSLVRKRRLGDLNPGWA